MQCQTYFEANKVSQHESIFTTSQQCHFASLVSFSTKNCLQPFAADQHSFPRKADLTHTLPFYYKGKIQFENISTALLTQLP